MGGPPAGQNASLVRGKGNRTIPVGEKRELTYVLGGKANRVVVLGVKTVAMTHSKQEGGVNLPRTRKKESQGNIGLYRVQTNTL